MELESDILASTLTYYLPVKSGRISGQKGGKINIENIENQKQIEGNGGKISGKINIGESGQISGKKSGQISGKKNGEETRKKIVDAMRQNPEITRSELAKVVGITPSTIQKHIEILKASEAIVRLGSDRKGLWKVLI